MVDRPPTKHTGSHLPCIFPHYMCVVFFLVANKPFCVHESDGLVLCSRVVDSVSLMQTERRGQPANCDMSQNVVEIQSDATSRLDSACLRGGRRASDTNFGEFFLFYYLFTRVSFRTINANLSALLYVLSAPIVRRNSRKNVFATVR